MSLEPCYCVLDSLHPVSSWKAGMEGRSSWSRDVGLTSLLSNIRDEKEFLYNLSIWIG